MFTFKSIETVQTKFTDFEIGQKVAEMKTKKVQMQCSGNGEHISITDFTEKNGSHPGDLTKNCIFKNDHKFFKLKGKPVDVGIECVEKEKVGVVVAKGSGQVVLRFGENLRMYSTENPEDVKYLEKLKTSYFEREVPGENSSFKFTNYLEVEKIEDARLIFSRISIITKSAEYIYLTLASTGVYLNKISSEIGDVSNKIKTFDREDLTSGDFYQLNDENILVQLKFGPNHFETYLINGKDNWKVLPTSCEVIENMPELAPGRFTKLGSVGLFFGRVESKEYGCLDEVFDKLSGEMRPACGLSQLERDCDEKLIDRVNFKEVLPKIVKRISPRKAALGNLARKKI